MDGPLSRAWSAATGALVMNGPEPDWASVRFSSLAMGLATGLTFFNIFFSLGYLVILLQQWQRGRSGDVRNRSLFANSVQYTKDWLGDLYVVSTTTMGTLAGGIYGYYAYPDGVTVAELVREFSVVKVLHFLIVMDAWNTGIHWAFHKVPKRWQWIHATHHQIKSYLDHPLFGLHAEPFEIIFYIAFITVYSQYIQLGYLNFCAVMNVLMVHVYVAHCEVELPYLNAFFNDGITHTMHHRFPNHNYGIMFGFWDKIIGTFRDPYEQARKDKLRKDGNQTLPRRGNDTKVGTRDLRQ
ncbi:hypothetical protein DFJ74DRAFT_678527 [Hyaloraphidium curvatum]|nr:hypothetical protein DFJ74DRAFT_678527 [Hyaloraphidium curvatum]